MGIRGVDAAGGQTTGPGQAAGYVWEGGEPFYGTRVGPGWYQTGTRVGKGVQTAILSIANAYASQVQATLEAKAGCGMRNADWPGKATQSHINATSKPPQSVLIATA